jgi:hypothetical protein
MSALPPKADMCSARTNVRYGAISGHFAARETKSALPPESGRSAAQNKCPLLANSGHGSQLAEDTFRPIAQSDNGLNRWTVGRWLDSSFDPRFQLLEEYRQ